MGAGDASRCFDIAIHFRYGLATMRTTLRIDDDILFAARSVAQAENRTMGQVISDLARRGLAPSPRESLDHGFPVFDVDTDAAPITLEMVRLANEDS